ncbi:MAG: tripartite tricarboxylate transporter substrate binding protein [Pigmentiphaga sp.]|uniref:Bug family tripartite tricarboxylate transporter substrate binding protein n=1 Tax=Pigmentiphaga sp. TaxID=1977564 RepID=UPI0029BF482D|nr:tripartite tricarboxylate transporter substrate binding protein [Pigmentiphaga sp.]MDX3905257.1 tripartite tricarboxylate transporter substrate binding protein [Pigmentiphaga sp.]
MKKRAFLSIALMALASAISPSAQADTFPSRAIRFVVPFGPGGGTDIVARLIAPYLSAQLGQQVVVENRPGAGGVIGSNMVAKGPADGYTILFADSARSIAPSMQKDLPFDITKDLDPIGLIAGTPLLLLAHPQAPVKTLDELIRYAKANPGKLTYGSSGNGTPQHFAVELLKSASGIDLVHVPYKGAAAVVADAVGGQINLAAATYAPSVEYIKSKRLIPLTVMEPKRLPALPEVPAAAEHYPEVVMSIWFGIMLPVGVDPAVRTKLVDAVKAVVANPEYAEKLRAAGFEPMRESAEEMKTRIAREVKLFGEVARKAGITPE